MNYVINTTTSEIYKKKRSWNEKLTKGCGLSMKSSTASCLWHTDHKWMIQIQCPDFPEEAIIQEIIDQWRLFGGGDSITILVLLSLLGVSS